MNKSDSLSLVQGPSTCKQQLIQEYLNKYFELFDTHESSQSEKNGETL